MWVTPNSWWTLNLVIPVWWLGIKLMYVLTSGQREHLLLCDTFILVHGQGGHYSTFHLNQHAKIILLGPNCYRLLALSWFHHQQLHQNTRNGCLLWKPDAMASYVSSGLLCLVRTLFDNSKLQFPLSIKSHKLWCQARELLLHLPLAVKMSASQLVYYFFQSSSGI